MAPVIKLISANAIPIIATGIVTINNNTTVTKSKYFIGSKW